MRTIDRNVGTHRVEIGTWEERGGRGLPGYSRSCVSCQLRRIVAAETSSNTFGQSIQCYSKQQMEEREEEREEEKERESVRLLNRYKQKERKR